MTTGYLFNDHVLCKAGADLIVRAGLVLPTGTELVDLFLGNIDQFGLNTDKTQNVINAKGRDGAKRLKLSSEHPRVFESQARFWAAGNISSDLEKFNTKITTTSFWQFNNTCIAAGPTNQRNHNFALAGWYGQQDVWLSAKMYFNGIYLAKGGLVWRANVACTQGYVFCYEHVSGGPSAPFTGRWKLGKLSEYRGAPNNDLTTLAVTSNFTSANATWYWLLVVNVANTIYCYVSTDGGITYGTPKITYTDPTPLRMSVLNADGTVTDTGACGLWGWPGYSKAGTSWVGFSNILFRNYGVDVTMEEIGQSMLATAGVLDTRREGLVDTISTANFTNTGVTGSGWGCTAGVMTFSKSGSARRINRGITEVSNFVLDFSMKLSAGDPAGIVFCCDELDYLNTTNYYIIEVETTGHVRLYYCKRGTQTLICDVPLSGVTIPSDVYLPYRLSYQDGFSSLWCGDTLLACFYHTARTTGYVGFAAKDTLNGTSWNSFRIGKLNTVVPQWSINVGEDLDSNLNRLLQDVLGCRFFEGTGRASLGTLVPLTGKTDVFGTLNPPDLRSKILASQWLKNDMDWYSVVRVDGDTCTATVRDDTLLQTKGYRFLYKKTDTVKSNAECAVLAANVITQALMQMSQRAFSFDADLRLERRDRIHIFNQKDGTDADYIIESVSFTYRRPTLTMTLELLDVPAET